MARTDKSASTVQMTGDKASAKQIAVARARFNQALADRDLSVIEHILSEECTLVPGDDAALMNGRQCQLDAWRSLMNQAPDLFYLRSPQRIDVSDDGLLAAETGRWKGQWSTQGMHVRYGGKYFAKWRLDGDDWRIESEVFVTLKREGSRA